MPLTKRIRQLSVQTHKLLGQYLAGRPVSFRRLRVDETGWTDFERCVLRALRKVGWGKVSCYGHLAELSGYPGAARAVGTVLRKNRIPIILPCHRIIGAQGVIGGYSWGIGWKKKLLTMEGHEMGKCGRFRVNEGLFLERKNEMKMKLNKNRV